MLKKHFFRMMTLLIGVMLVFTLAGCSNGTNGKGNGNGNGNGNGGNGNGNGNGGNGNGGNNVGSLVLGSGYAWVLTGMVPEFQTAYTFSGDNKWSQYMRYNSPWSEIESGTYTVTGNKLDMGTGSEYTFSVTSNTLTFAGDTYTKTAFTPPAK